MCQPECSGRNEKTRLRRPARSSAKRQAAGAHVKERVATTGQNECCDRLIRQSNDAQCREDDAGK